MNPKEGCTEEEEAEFETLEKKLSMARDVVDYLEDMLPEVQKVPTGNLKRPARLDVLAVAMIEINKFLTLRLTPLVDPSVMDTSNITLGDLHGIIGWLTYYKLVLSDIYCPPVKAGDASPSTFPLFHLIPDLCQWYVEGVPGTTCEGAAKHIKGHVLKVFHQVSSAAASDLLLLLLLMCRYLKILLLILRKCCKDTLMELSSLTLQRIFGSYYTTTCLLLLPHRRQSCPF